MVKLPPDYSWGARDARGQWAGQFGMVVRNVRVLFFHFIYLYAHDPITSYIEAMTWKEYTLISSLYNVNYSQ